MTMEQQELEEVLRRRLVRCQKLALEFPYGLTMVNLRELETEIRSQLDELKRSDDAERH
jgi:hypothetical protein